MHCLHIGSHVSYFLLLLAPVRNNVLEVLYLPNMTQKARLLSFS